MAELFAEHPKPFSKATMLFTQRRAPTELFNNPVPNLSEYDFLLAAVLLGAHVRWRYLATEWKATKSLQNAVGARMASILHRTAGENVSSLHIDEPATPEAYCFKLHPPLVKSKSKAAKFDHERRAELAKFFLPAAVSYQLIIKSNVCSMDSTGSRLLIRFDGDYELTSVVDDELLADTLLQLHPLDSKFLKADRLKPRTIGVVDELEGADAADS